MRAQRLTGEMDAVDAERVEHRDDVIGHVGQGVLGVLGKMRRQPAVADVDPYDEKPTIDEAVAELFSPIEHLAAEPADQHQRRIVLESEGVVVDAQVT